MKPIRVAVIGAGTDDATERNMADAYEVGRLLADRATVICGGRGGVMQGVSRGISDHGGTVIGILPGTEEQANPYLTIPIPTGLGEARNVIVASAAHGVIAIGGSYGTLSEIAFALKLRLPVIGLRTWRIEDPQGNTEHLVVTDSPAQAVEEVMKRIERQET